MPTRKRPAPLNLKHTKPVPGTLRTPKDLAQDIARHCLSPTLPRGLSVEMLAKSREIEAQQRQLIVQREISVYEKRNERENSVDEDKKSAEPSQTTTPNQATQASMQTAQPPDSATVLHSSRQQPPQPPHINPTPTSPNSNSSMMSNSSEEAAALALPNLRSRLGSASMPGSATSSSFSGRPWELGQTPQSAKDDSRTLQERRGARPVTLDVDALSRNSPQTSSVPPQSSSGMKRLREEEEYAEENAIDDDDEPPKSQPQQQSQQQQAQPGVPYVIPVPIFPGGDALPQSAHTSPNKKARYLQLCSEIWDLLKAP